MQGATRPRSRWGLGLTAVILGLGLGLAATGSVRAQSQSGPAKVSELPMAQAATPQSAPEPVVEVEALQVLASRPGPMVWVIKKGAGKVYLMGAVSPLPNDLKWDSSRLDYLISKSDQVLLGKNPEMRISEAFRLIAKHPIAFFLRGEVTPRDYFTLPPGRTLRLEVGDKKYEELAEFLKKYDLNIKSYDQNQPIAPIFDVTGKVLMKHNLMDASDAEAAAESLANKYRKKILYSARYDVLKVQTDLFNVSPLEQMRCFYGLRGIEARGVGAVAESARKWASGQELIYEKSASYIFEDICFAASPRYDQVKQKEYSDVWVNILMALDQEKVSTAVVPIHLISRPGGLLDSFKAAGLEVIGVDWRTPSRK